MIDLYHPSGPPPKKQAGKIGWTVNKSHYPTALKSDKLVQSPIRVGGGCGIVEFVGCMVHYGPRN